MAAAAPPPAGSGARSDADHAEGDGPAGAFEVIVPKPPGYLGFVFRDRRTGQLFRVGPGRYPGQPRFYGLWFHRCLTQGIVDPTDPPRLGSGCLRWEELGPAVAAVRDDLDGWLMRENHRDIRDWILRR
jgi:hypothetical protein